MTRDPISCFLPILAIHFSAPLSQNGSPVASLRLRPRSGLHRPRVSQRSTLPAKRDSDEVSATLPHLEKESDEKPLSADAMKDQNTLYFKPRSGLHENRLDAGSLKELRPQEGGSSEGLGNPVDEDSWIANVTCDMCMFIVGELQKLVSEQKTQEEIKIYAEEFCKAEKIETPRVCDLVLPQYMVRVV